MVTVIGFIGIGVMGSGMVGNLLRAGYEVHIYSRTKAKAAGVTSQGAIWHDSVADVVQTAQVVITMVGLPTDVEDLYLTEQGIINLVQPGTYLIDMTTSSPTLAKRIAEVAQNRQLYALDAPVSGGDIGAKNGTLSIMVGGDESAFADMLPVFQAMGKNIVLQGGPGAGQHTKMCNQITVAGNMVGVCEALAYASKSGLDPTMVLESIASGAAASWTLSNLAPRIIDRNFEPGFYVKHFIKDMRIALSSAQEMGLQTPGLALVLSLYEQLAEMGEAESGTHALYKLFEA